MGNLNKKCCNNCKYSSESFGLPEHFKFYLMCNEDTERKIPVEPSAVCNFFKHKNEENER